MLYRVYYTEDINAPLTEWNVKLVQVDSALIQSDVSESAGTLTLLTHLRSNATYHIRISAANIKGDGPISSPYAVIVRPGALPSPVNFKAVSKSAHEVSLHWQTPETQQRGPPLVNYELLVTPIDGDGNTDSTSRRIFIEPSLNSYLVNALLPNTKYEFRLAAVSESGAGIPSEATAKTKEYVPGPPNRVTVEATGSDRLKVTWTPPKEAISPSLLASMGQRANELRIAYYDVDVRATDAKGNWLSGTHYGTVEQQRPIRQQSTSDQKIEEARGKLTYSKEISGLLPSTHYVVHIRAVSRSGSGDRAKSSPTMTWPLPPLRPTNLKLRTIVSPSSRHRIIQVHWKPPMQEKIPVGGFKYRVQWRLLISPKMIRKSTDLQRYRREFDNADLEPITSEQAKELGIAEEFIGDEENVTKLNWNSPPGKLLGGLSYEIRVATMDEYQTGESVIGRIELPDDVPSLPPSGVRIDTTSPYLLLYWKAPLLEARNGRLVAYEAECSWTDVSQGFTESWQTNSVKIEPESPVPSTLFWSAGHISLLNMSAPTVASFGTIYRGRVRAWTSIGPGPWSEYESLSLKSLLPKEPDSVNAVLIEKKGVLVTWGIPDGFIQTSFHRSNSRGKPEVRSLTYRRFEVEYAKQQAIGEQMNWQSFHTAGPQTSITLPIFENPEQYVVRVRSIGIANLHSDWTSPILIRRAHPIGTAVIDDLKCHAVAGDGKNAELELTWIIFLNKNSDFAFLFEIGNDLVANLIKLCDSLGKHIFSFQVNYTGGRVYLNSKGHRIRETQGEREQSVISPDSSYRMIVHRLVGLKFNTAYQINVLPVFERTAQFGMYSEAKSAFCRTLSKPPRYIPMPDFRPPMGVIPGEVTVYRANEQNGTVTTYELLARESGTPENAHAPAVLAQFPAVTLFRPLTKAVRIVLNGSTSNLGRDSGLFFAPSLLSGQAYDIAVRACVEGHDAFGSEIDVLRNGGLDTASPCSTSDWSGPGAQDSTKPDPDQSELENLADLEDDPIWPPIIRENISAMVTSPQTPFNDAATVSKSGDQDPSSTEVYFPSTNLIAESILSTPTLSEPNFYNHRDRIQVIVAALSVVIGTCIMAFIFFLIARHFQKRNQHRHLGNGAKLSGSTVKPLETSGSAAPVKAMNIRGVGTFSSATAPLLRYEPMGRGLRTPDGLSLHSEQMIGGCSSSLRRYNGGLAAAMTLPASITGGTIDGPYACSSPVNGINSMEMVSPAGTLNSRHPPPPYFMHLPAPVIPGIIDEHSASHSVALEDLAKHVEQLKQNQGLLLSSEFESIDPGGQFTWEHSSRPANRPKNRYANVVTYDHSRVILSRVDGDMDSDYINANFLTGYNHKCSYIATQGPLPNTICDFWRMIWEQHCSTIVAMTRLEERDRVKCEQYWPTSCLPTNALLSPTKSADWLSPRSTLTSNSESSQNVGSVGGSPIATTTYGQITVSLMESVELAYYTIRTFTVQKSGCREKRDVRQLQFTAWPDHGVPNHPAPLLMFLRRVNAEFVPEAGPIVVHCSAGVGRTGAYIVLDILLQQMHHENAVDVLSVVTQLRSQRNFIVQTEEQYVFIYEALLEAALSGNTELPARQLRGHWHKLMVPCCPEDELLQTQNSDSDPLANTGLALEFDQLVNQTVGPVASLVAHQSPGGLLACGDDYCDTSGDIASGAISVNIPKNRGGFEVIPCESNRVKLSPIRGVEGSDYINASYIDSYRLRSAFIATQTPFPAFVEDFWRMIWESGSCIIVQLDPYDFDKEPPYWPTEEAARYGFLVAEPLATYDMTVYVLREFRLTDAKSGQSRIIRLFEASQLSLLIGRVLVSSRHLNRDPSDVTLPPSLPPLAEWLPNRLSSNNTPSFGFMSGGNNYYRSTSSDSQKKNVFDELTCQKAAVNLIDLIEQVHKTQEQFGLEGPITVHCRTGTGYTGIFLMLSILFERMRIEGVVDAFQTTKLLWWQRRGLVESSTEYAFCYATALEYLSLYEPLPNTQLATNPPSSNLS
ncbi:unnamed protein product [Rodentolepis nana]|uniref:Protein-tyrosine-phosphatase n=1 Tax=Rodentolepis nana TaxID=102285 RepID=A0A158QIW7_RODNA|nr:unnamed protein product [Rodentolepis nana]